MSTMTMSNTSGGDLADRVRAGREARQRLQAEPADLDPFTRRRLARLERDGQEAMMRLLDSHAALLHRTAYRATRGMGGAGHEDALQAARLAFIEAAYSYDPDRGPLHSYATARVRGAAFEAAAVVAGQTRWQRRLGGMVADGEARQYQRHHREPTHAEVAAHVSAQPSCTHAPPVDHIEQVRAMTRHGVAPYEEARDDHGHAQSAESVAMRVIETTTITERVRRAVARLPEPERRVVIARHRLNEERPAHTPMRWEEVAVAVGMGRRRTRAIGEQAEERLRALLRDTCHPDTPVVA